MLSLRSAPTPSTKQKLSTTLRSWLPILQSNLESLKETLEPFCEANPLLEIRSANERTEVGSKFFKRNLFEQISKNSATDAIEALTFSKNSLYETLYEQINPPLFPTPKSQEIALKIIEQIDKDGYYAPEDEWWMKEGFKKSEVEHIRKRFAYLLPPGVGAENMQEAFLFQLEDLDICAKLYSQVKVIIEDFISLESYMDEPYFQEAVAIIKRFKIPPAIEFFEEESHVVPDLFVFETDGMLEVKLNDEYYPDVIIDAKGMDKSNEFVAQKLKDAADLIDALEMRKATLYKLGLMIVEYQYDFFIGGVIRPMKLKDLADELERNPSTISRAIANKYLACNRGVIPMKQFFSTAIDEDTSNATIKDYLQELIAKESQEKPLSDAKILALIEEKFSVKMVRRTITKYRKQLNIASSSERKKLYKYQC
ncbi:MAG: RNA polymerase factor sigma-54 [Campylobacteraceae bacterium]|nr:RNA polymerase factor sigma-54 [Campylobacteraceae bacterium]